MLPGFLKLCINVLYGQLDIRRNDTTALSLVDINEELIECVANFGFWSSILLELVTEDVFSERSHRHRALKGCIHIARVSYIFKTDAIVLEYLIMALKLRLVIFLAGGGLLDVANRIHINHSSPLFEIHHGVFMPVNCVLNNFHDLDIILPFLNS